MSSANDGASIRSRRARLQANAALVACLITPGLLTWAWSRPTPIAPREMPPLVLEPRAVEAQREADRRAAEAAEDDETRQRLYHRANLAQHEGSEPPGRARARRDALARWATERVDAHGEGSLDGVRARDLARAEAALRGTLPAADRAAELGGFVDTLERYGVIRDGRTTGPRAVVRVLFKARWNAMHARPLTEGLSPIERQAYWGWLAIRGDAATIERRLEAAEHYADAGGGRGAELRGVLLYHEGRLDEARAAFEAAYAENPSFRLQNHILACTAAGEDHLASGAAARAGAKASRATRLDEGSDAI